MASIKSLFKDTAIYGLSSIVGRFLNWLLVPMYTYTFAEGEYGIVTNIYAYVALLIVILTYGMETGLFRFINDKKWTNKQEVYTTTLTSLIFTSSTFILLGCFFSPTIARWLEYGDHASYIWMMVITVGIDAFTSLPFAYLRYQKRAIRFAYIKFTNIAINIGLNLFFILLCPQIWKHNPEWISWFYNPDFGIGYIFVANLISSGATMLLLFPEIFGQRYQFNGRLLRDMLKYSYPILILGIAGIMNQNLDKILYPILVPGEIGQQQLGVYGACFKIGIVMVMFTQAFRYAYEPFIFSQLKEEKDADRKRSYSLAMNWFVAFSMLIFIGVMFYLPILKYFIKSTYFSGLKVVPVIMMAEVFAGVFFNLSLWYKLTDKTIWGTWFSLMGLVITLAINVIFVPHIGYMACAWAAFCCYGVMMLACFFIGQKKYPIRYDLGRLGLYMVVALALWLLSMGVESGNNWVDFPARFLMLVAYCGSVLLINRFFDRRKQLA